MQDKIKKKQEHHLLTEIADEKEYRIGKAGRKKKQCWQEKIENIVGL